MKNNPDPIKNEFNGALALGGIFMLSVLIIFPALGISFQGGFDTITILWVVMGMICSYLAYKKNKHPKKALFMGILFGPFSILYYLFCKSDMSPKEKEIFNW